MSEGSGNPENGPPKKRGEAAWKEEKERIAERNEQVSRAGREQRKAYEQEKTQARHAAERRHMAELSKREGR